MCEWVAIIDHGRISDIGTPDERIRRHSPERTVVISTPDPSVGERFRMIPQVESVDAHDGRFTIRGRGEDFVTRIIECIAEHRIVVTDFSTARSTLEDVFLKVTGHSIRN